MPRQSTTSNQVSIPQTVYQPAYKGDYSKAVPIICQIYIKPAHINQTISAMMWNWSLLKESGRQLIGGKISLGVKMKGTLEQQASTAASRKHFIVDYLIISQMFNFCDSKHYANNFNSMKENQIKLNQIVTDKQLKQRKRGSLHALNNSFKRNTLYNSESANKYSSCYQCKLPEVNFTRRDLSIILRYLLYKQDKEPSDRNLLRRILLNSFDQELIAAGSKNFVNLLKLEEGNRYCDVNQNGYKYFYFVLKGKGTVQSRDFQYNINEGTTFGHIQLLAEERIRSIQFQSKFILLKLQQNHFNEFFKDYYQKIFEEKLSQLTSVRQSFLEKIPSINKYLFLQKIQYRSFETGEKIIIENQQLKFLYFLSNNTITDDANNKCIGLSQLLKQRRFVKQTIYCNKKITVPYVSVELFYEYILNYIGGWMMAESSLIERLKNDTKSTFEEPQRLTKFMRVKKVKLPFNRSRLKTENTDFYETNFKFFKHSQIPNFNNPQKQSRQTRLSSKSRYQATRMTSQSRTFHNIL